MLVTENHPATALSADAQMAGGARLLATVPVQQKMGADGQRLVDLHGQAGGGERRRQPAVVIAADQTQAGAFTYVEGQPPQLGVKRGRLHGAVEDIPEQDQLARGVAIEQREE